MAKSGFKVKANDSSNEFLQNMLKTITAELLESSEQLQDLGKLYEKQIAELEVRIAENEAKTIENKARVSESEARIAENEIIAAQHTEHTVKNKEKEARLQEILTVTEKISHLSTTGTALLKALTPLQIEFKEQVNQRTELTNKIAAKIKICQTQLNENHEDDLENQIALLEIDFQTLAQHIAVENQAQDNLLDVLDSYEVIVTQIKNTLDTIRRPSTYYDAIKENIYNVEVGYLNEVNLMLEANRPAKTGSDMLGQKCEQAFLLIKQRLQQKTAGYTPAPMDAPPSKSKKVEESDRDRAGIDCSPSNNNQSNFEEEPNSSVRRSSLSALSLYKAHLSQAQTEEKMPLAVNKPTTNF